MIVSDVLDIYKDEQNYVENSMIDVSYDDLGCVFKFLNILPGNKFAIRREIFIATSTAGTLEDRTVITYIELDHAS